MAVRGKTFAEWFGDRRAIGLCTRVRPHTLLYGVHGDSSMLRHVSSPVYSLQCDFCNAYGPSAAAPQAARDLAAGQGWFSEFLPDDAHTFSLCAACRARVARFPLFDAQEADTVTYAPLADLSPAD